MGKSRYRLAVLAVMVLAAPVALGQDPNVCDEPGDYPDVIVGDLQSVNSYGNVGDIYAYAVGTTSCNIGTCWLNWNSGNSDHPVIGQNMFKLLDGRLTQIGQSWLKHGFFALSEDLCSDSCVSTSGGHLGVNCSDPYTAGLNGQQTNLGPRWEVNAATGAFPFPFETQGVSGDAIYKRLQVHRDDLDPGLNPGARYFVEGQYVAADDAAAQRDNNNNSYREITIDPVTFDAAVIGTTVRQTPGISIWGDVQSGVRGASIDVVNDGRIIVAGGTTDNGDGTRRFEYAVHNINSDRSGQAFWVPVPSGSTVTNIGFHDVDAHSDSPYDNTDWIGYHDVENSRVIWETDDFAVNPDANAIRWGTMYNFWFDVDASSRLGSVFVDLFKPGLVGDPDTVDGRVFAPNPCNNDGVCDPQEDCTICAADCETQGVPTGFCGDGICEVELLEDCANCPSDCAGVQSGNPSNRYCCGAGGGDGPIPCTDIRCNQGGFTCGSTGIVYCCGDAVCDPSEDQCICAADCGKPPATEISCTDAFDNDCDGNSDCSDRDCCTDATCITGTDNDSDGVADCDCDDTDPNVWETPGEVPALTVAKGAGGASMLDWVAPGAPGATSVSYETLRSGDPEDFVLANICVADGSPGDLTNVDTDIPALGALFQYLVRATNACPGADGIGTLGTDSADNTRPGSICP